MDAQINSYFIPKDPKREREEQTFTRCLQQRSSTKQTCPFQLSSFVGFTIMRSEPR